MILSLAARAHAGLWQWGYSVLGWTVLAWPLAMGGSALLFLSALQLLSVAGLDLAALQSPPEQNPLSPGDWVGTVALAPLVETLLLGVGLDALRRWGVPAARAVLWSALGWGLLHACIAPIWFFGTVWAFYLHSIGYWRWRERRYRQGFWAAALPHVLSNATVLGVLALAGQ